MSTRKAGSPSRLRFSREPADGSIFNFTPLRARIARYFSADFWKALPSGPVVMVMVWGGAE